MRNRKLEEWVARKLDEGVEEERLRNVLEKKGHDPAIIDKAKQSTSQEKTGNKKDMNLRRGEGTGDGKVDLGGETYELDEDFSDKKDFQGLHGQSEKETIDLSQKESEDESEEKYSNDINEKRDHLEEIGESVSSRIKKDVSRMWKPVVGLLLISGLVLGAWMFIPFGAITGAVKDVDVGNLLENSVSPDKEDQDSAEKNVVYDSPKVYLNERVAKPSRPSITQDEEIMFVSNVSYGLKISFESGVEDFTLEPGESRKLDINSLVYYTAKPVGNIDKPDVKGSVYVE